VTYLLLAAGAIPVLRVLAGIVTHTHRKENRS